MAPSAAPTATPREDVIQSKCGVTSLERSRDILSILSLISDQSSLTTPGDPAFLARSWLDEEDGGVVCATAEERVAQRYRMALLYFQMGGSSWSNCRAEQDGGSCQEREGSRRRLRALEAENNPLLDTNEEAEQEGLSSVPGVRFLDASNECEWFGIECGSAFASRNTDDAYFPILGIDLKNNNMSGDLFVELFGLTQLQGIFLDGNRGITGQILPEVGQWTKLKHFDMDDNQISGSLPDELWTLTELRGIDLNDNMLEGDLSADVEKLVQLEVLQLQHNKFDGTVPHDALLKLERIVALTIEGNLWTGTLNPLCDIRDERRETFEHYLTFVSADCASDPPLVVCSCCQECF